MEIPASLPVDTNQNGGSPQTSSVLGQDDFLKLLVTQLSNQDPLNPLDGQQFAAQLAQFSSVEQLVNIGSTVEQNGATMDLLNQTTNAGIASSLIGSTVEALGNDFSFDGDGSVPISFELDANASDVSIEIRDAAGNLVRTLSLGANDVGRHDYDWDGKNDDGATVQAGQYTFDITAKDSNDNLIATTSLVRGEIDRVTFGADGILLWIGDTSIPLANITTVEE